MKIKQLISFSLFACGLLATSTSAWADAAADVSVEAPYVRAVPPGQPNSAAFMKLNNNGAAAHSVVNAKSTVSKVVELHTHTMEDGMMKMRQIPKMDIPANSSLELKPGGLHVMFIGLEQQLKPGDTVNFTLVFEDGSEAEIQAPVQKIAMPGKMGGHGHH